MVAKTLFILFLFHMCVLMTRWDNIQLIHCSVNDIAILCDDVVIDCQLNECPQQQRRRVRRAASTRLLCGEMLRTVHRSVTPVASGPIIL